MKKIYTLLIMITILLTACYYAREKTMKHGYDLGSEIKSLDDWNEIAQSDRDTDNSQFVCLAQPKPIEEIIFNSYIIVKVKIDEVQEVKQDFSCSLGTLYEYKSTIVEFLKGEIKETDFGFEMYSLTSYYHNGITNVSIFEEGKEYILFIRKNKSIYLGDRYGVDSLIFETKGEKIVKQYQHGRLYKDKIFFIEDDFKEFLQQNIKDQSENGKFFGCDYIESDNVRKIVGFSEIIAKINLAEVNIVNTERGLSSVVVKCVERYKGQMPEKMNLTLFNEDIRIGEEAIILLSTAVYQNGEGYDFAPSSRNSVIYNDDDRYEEYLAYIGLDYLMRKEYLKDFGLNED